MGQELARKLKGIIDQAQGEVQADGAEELWKSELCCQLQVSGCHQLTTSSLEHRRLACTALAHVSGSVSWCRWPSE